jgi:hypothetical protein
LLLARASRIQTANIDISRLMIHALTARPFDQGIQLFYTRGLVVLNSTWQQTQSRIPETRWIMTLNIPKSGTYGHSQLKTGHPVRSAIHKQLNGRLVLRWVTTWESLLLYVLHVFCSPAIFCRALSALTQFCNSLGPCWLGQLISSIAALTESED